jgi:peptidoglycan/xylan/chitin deacetylase (PgdA/CDA1 family)/GT2 family glycosyltransferase
MRLALLMDEIDPDTDAAAFAPLIGVVMPARNAGETIAETLESLRNQTYLRWEAVVVDDGSTDETRAIAQRYAAEDARIRVIQGPVRGVSAARNAGIAQLETQWLLFLDADDTIAPTMMSRMIEALDRDENADVVHCGWTYTDEHGHAFETRRCEDASPDLFPLLTRHCPFAIHACVIRRSMVVVAGGFDEALRTSEEFDLWQRVARMGARFVLVDDSLVTYRLRPKASWFDPTSFLNDALTVVRRGHTSDPRLDDALVVAAHRHGASPTLLPAVEYNLLTWAAAIAIVSGEAPLPLLKLVPYEGESQIDPSQVAGSLFNAVPLSLRKTTDEWSSLWPRFEESLRDFLQALEQHCKAPGLAARIYQILGERVIDRVIASASCDEDAISAPVIVGATAAVRIAATRPIVDLDLPGVDRLFCGVYCEGTLLGSLQLPVTEGRAFGAIIADAVAARFFWQLLDRLFARHVYPALAVEHYDNGGMISRDGTVIASQIDSDPRDRLHDVVGWPIFVQELFGQGNWPPERIYDAVTCDPDNSGTERKGTSFERIEVSTSIPSLTDLVGDSIAVELSIAGFPVVSATVPVLDGRVESSVLRATLLDQGQTELAAIAVREGVLGQSLDDSVPLLQRLQKRAAEVEAWRVPDYELLAGDHGAGQDTDWARIAGGLMRPDGVESVTLIGSAPILSADMPHPRRSPLPVAVLETVMANLAPHQPAIRVGSGPVGFAGYLPDLTPVAGRPLSGASTKNELPSELQAAGADHLPILMYHRVAPEGSAALARWRVTPEQFDAQMRYLSETGFQLASFEEWRHARVNHAPLSGRRVLITFDDGYTDFVEYAFPILQRYGLTATVFLPTDLMGDSARWDAWSGETASIMSWDDARRLRDRGISFGSHAASHRRLTELTPGEIVEEGIRSRVAIERQLEIKVDSIAYPFGAHDDAVDCLIGACGYLHGVTTHPAISQFSESPLALSRVEIWGDDGLDQFIARLEPTAAP